VTRVYVDMVGDLFHYGHVEMLRRARELGDELVVGVLSDESVESYKRRPIMTLEERVRVVEACRYADEVLVDVPLQASAEWLAEHRIDLVVHGDDFDEEALAYWYGAAQALGIFQTLPHTPAISTTALIERVLARELAG
jgi:cytidyltransferase-like protein